MNLADPVVSDTLQTEVGDTERATPLAQPAKPLRARSLSGGLTKRVTRTMRAASAPAIVVTEPICDVPGQKSDGPTSADTHTIQAVSASANEAPRSLSGLPTHPGGQLGSAAHVSAASGTDSGSHLRSDAHASDASGGDDQVLCETHFAPVVAEIVQLWRMRQRWHRAEKSLVLQGKAVCRSWTGGDKEAAGKLFDAIAEQQPDADPVLQTALLPFLGAIKTFEPERTALEKRLRKLEQKLPVYPWAEAVKGFGDLRLAALVGECGDIGGYRNPACVWKRMGLAVIRGERQRRVSDAELAVEMGYSPERRAVAFLLGQEVMRGADPKYRPIYDARKAYELERCEALADGMGERYSPKAHAHNRACRYMVKRILRDLWVAWRTAGK